MEVWKEPSVLISYRIVILLFLLVVTWLFCPLHKKSLKKMLDTKMKRATAETVHQKNKIKLV